MECPRCHKQTSLLAPRCWSCGATIPPGQFLLEEAGVVPAGEPESSPQIQAPVPAGTAPYPLATLGDRCVALVLDSLALLAVFSIVDTCAYLRWSVVTRGEWTLTGALVAICAAADLIIFFLWFWLLEASFGATLGKAIVGIRVSGDDRRTALAASAIRNLLRIIDGLGFYLVGVAVAGCTRLRQRLGDMCAGTVVISPQLSAWISPVAIALWIAMLSATAWTLPHIWARGHAGHRLPVFGRVVARIGHTDSSLYLKITRFKLELQRNDAHGSPSPSSQQPLPTPVAVAGGD